MPEDKLIEIVEVVRRGLVDLGFDVSEAVESQITRKAETGSFGLK